MCKFWFGSGAKIAGQPNTLEELSELCEQTLASVTGIGLRHRGARWRSFLIVGLVQANERLHAVKLLLEADHTDSATILMRSLFELAVNLAFIEHDKEPLLEEYLRHGHVPLTSEEAQEIEQAIKAGAEAPVPRSSWRSPRNMCGQLGNGWIREYDALYAYASVVTHAGSFTFGQQLIDLIAGNKPDDATKTRVLVTALTYHLRVAEIVAREFPESIEPHTISDYHERCDEIGQRLAAQRGASAAS